MHVEIIGKKGAFPIVFGHGWGRDHKDFIPIAELVSDRAYCVLVDFPGFGASPRPSEAWGTEDYARETRAFLEHDLGLKHFIWVGHSFGGRVGLRIGEMNDCPIDELFIVAGAGVKQPRTTTSRIRSHWRSWKFRHLKAKAQNERELIDLEKRFGSSDYVQSRSLGMRDIFLKTVQEDQSSLVGSITCPTTLVYGSKDTETPPQIGRILHELIPNSNYLECPEFDHHSILTRGRHQLALMLRETLSGHRP